MSAEQLINDHLDLWTSAVTYKSGRGASKNRELTGIKKLRELILELAVRGKLVEQDPNDEPAGMLLEKIDKEKAQLANEGKIKKPKKLPPVVADDFDASIPSGWEVTRLGELLVRISNGFGGKQNKKGEGHRLTRIETISDGSIDPEKVGYSPDIPDDKLEYYKLQPNDILFSHINSDYHIGKTAIVPEGVDLFHGVNLLLIRPSSFISSSFIDIFINRLRLGGYFLKIAQHAIGQASINQRKATSIIIPLPPEAEQHRIVAKVDELMALCDRLEQQTGDHLDAHKVLVDTLLDALTRAEDAEEVAAQWARLAEHFDTLFTTDASIDKLRQAILQLAVMGRLVEQNPNDEPASVLLERIAEEKARLVEEGKIKKPKTLPEIERNEETFPKPTGWVWARFGTITFNRDSERIPLSVGDRSRRKGKYDYYGASGVIDKIDEYLFDKPLLLIGEDGANLINRSTPIAFMARGNYWVNNHAHVLDGMSEGFLIYLSLYINAISLEPYVTGTAQPKMNQAKMNTIVVGLPPEQEQKRIIKKYSELIALCDSLKSHLNDAGEIRAHLAEAVVTQAVE